MHNSDEVVPYRALLRLPGAMRAFAASSLCRLSYSTVGLAQLYVIERATGSFGVAGLASAAFGVCALSAPLKSRLVDRYGQRRLIAVLGAAYGASLLALAVLAIADVRNGVIYVTVAGLAGLLAPPLGPAMRAVWATLSEGVATRQRVYSFDLAVEDTLFTVGPLVVGGLVVLHGPTLAVVVTAGLMLVGSQSLARSPAVKAHDERAPTWQKGPRSGPLRSPGFAVLVGIVLVLSSGCGVVDVAVAARALRAGTPAAAGYVLAALALGSVIGGQLWARRARAGTISTQLAVLSVVLIVSLAGAAEAPDLAVLAVVLAVFGAALTPVLIVAYVAADRLVPRAGRTEASTWVNTAFNAGNALGLAVAGLAVDRDGPTGSFFLGTAVAVIALIVIVTLGRRLDRSLSHQASSPD
jgi:predicted MFS family arabinose efflux permease